MCIALKTEGRRIYFQGNTFACKDAIKEMGGKWDADQKMWWVGTTKKEAAEALVAKLEASSDTRSPGEILQGRLADKPDAKPADNRLSEQELKEQVVRARATYKQKSYYVVAQTRDGSRTKLVANDGFTFWADSTAVQTTKTYGRENYRTGRTEYPTIGDLRDYAERARAEERGESDAPTKICWECGCAFTQRHARSNEGDWADSYCGC